MKNILVNIQLLRIHWISLFVMCTAIGIASSLLAISRGEIRSGFSPPETSKRQDVESLVECQLMCDRDLKCISFFFNGLKKLCALQTIAYVDSTVLTAEYGWTYMDVIDRKCGLDYIFHRESNTCYKAYRDHQIMNITKFREICSGDGAELLRIKSKEFSDHITQFLESQTDTVAHLAIQGEWNGTHWIFDDETPLNYFNWFEGGNITTKKSNQIFILSRTHRIFKWQSFNPIRWDLVSGVICGKSVR